MFRLASVVDCCLSSPRAGVCSLLQRRRVPSDVADGTVSYTLVALCIDRFSGHSWPILDFPLCEFSAGLCRFSLA